MKQAINASFLPYLGVASFSRFRALIAHLFIALFCDLRQDIWGKSRISQAPPGAVSDAQRKVEALLLCQDMALTQAR